MCFSFTITKFQEFIEKYYESEFSGKVNFPLFLNAFSRPFAPVITQEASCVIQMYSWTLIPFWIKNKKDSVAKTMYNYNSRSETIFEKVSFKYSIKNKRCLVPADGFFEYHEFNRKKYPFYIKFPDHRLFSFAGIYSTWTDPFTGADYNTFSIITVDANKLLAKIYNTKKRMPVILDRKNEKIWLDNNLTEQKQIQNLMKAYPDGELEAYPVEKNFLKTNSIEKCSYPELPADEWK